MKRCESRKPESMSKAARLFGLLDATGRSRLLAGSIRRTFQLGEIVPLQLRQRAGNVALLPAARRL